MSDAKAGAVITGLPIGVPCGDNTRTKHKAMPDSPLALVHHLSQSLPHPHIFVTHFWSYKVS